MSNQEHPLSNQEQKTNLASNLKNLRIAKNLTVDEMSDCVNVTRATYYRYESGNIQSLPFDTLEKLARVCEVTIDELLYGDVSKKANEMSKQNYFSSIMDYMKELSTDSLYRLYGYSSKLLDKTDTLESNVSSDSLRYAIIEAVNTSKNDQAYKITDYAFKLLKLEEMDKDLDGLSDNEARNARYTEMYTQEIKDNENAINSLEKLGEEGSGNDE
ncbi:transcriptional regulator with XRE-family HTH domain [Lachnospiraceae bacterium PF1-22]